MYPRLSSVPVWATLFTLLLKTQTLSADKLVLETTYGKLRGFEKQAGETKLNIYLGVPFAKPPVGNLRFKRPEVMAPWEGVKDATMLPPDCIQPNRTLGIMTMFNPTYKPKTSISEDCLYLNIWAPSGISDRRRAVLVWIHGGGFTSGSSTLDMYNGKKLASSQGVIVITLNYRLGPLGFLYNGKDEAPGNVGLIDQQMALRWVKENIARFGGDPERITIFGESAGSFSASYHLLAAGSHDFFNNAILQSGSAFNSLGYKKPVVAKAMSRAFAQSVGCDDEDDIDCLLQLSAVTISETKQDKVSLPRTVDGYFLTDEPTALLKRGEAKKTSIIVGFNRNEGSLFGPVFFPQYLHFSQKEASLTLEQYNKMLAGTLYFLFGRKNKIFTEAVEFQYTNIKQPQNLSYLDLYDEIIGDAMITCGAVDFAKHYAESGGDVYMYILDHRPMDAPWPEWMGAIHGQDIFYVFNNTEGYTFTTEEKQPSDRMMTYWANLAKTGNPKGASLPDWPLYSATQQRYLALDVGHSLMAGHRPRARECAFWNYYIPKLISEIDKCSSESSGKDPLRSTLLILVLATSCVHEVTRVTAYL